MLIVIASSEQMHCFWDFGKETSSTDVLFTDPQSVGLVVFTGGADINPLMYGELPHARTYTNIRRDDAEKQVFDRTLELGIPMLGICRGAQLLCVLSGGRLVQHVTNHQGVWHDIQTEDGRIIPVNSLHHQMQVPPPGAEIIAWSAPSRSTSYEYDFELPVEPEVVYYPGINSLGIQFHPELMGRHSEGFRYTLELAEKLITGRFKSHS